MRNFKEIKSEKISKQKSKFQMERNKIRQETEIYFNGLLLGRSCFELGKTYYIDDETGEIIQAGNYINPFQAGEELLKIHKSRLTIREERINKKYQEWLNSPIVKKMLGDYNNLPEDDFKPKEFKTFYRRNIFEYENKYPELV